MEALDIPNVAFFLFAVCLSICDAATYLTLVIVSLRSSRALGEQLIRKSYRRLGWLTIALGAAIVGYWSLGAAQSKAAIVGNWWVAPLGLGLGVAFALLERTMERRRLTADLNG